LNVWQSLARISGVAFQVVAAVGLGVAAGVGLDHLVPSIGSAGVLVGAAVGFGAAIYVMVTGMRAYVNSEDNQPKEK
jgi:F0F1-type ATP synthase assembly protein I